MTPDRELEQDAELLGRLDAEAGRPRQTSFLGDDLRKAYFRGYDNAPEEQEKAA